ncbi:hypothetical protein MUP65_00435, partial [Patescibacteria group bacterium]|nr:hypothetical protein [Patescibacteria group bacterium]
RLMNSQTLRANYDVYLGDDGIIYDEIEKMESDPEKSAQMAELEHQSVRKILIENPKSKYPLLIDLSLVSKRLKYMSKNARQSYVALMAEPQVVRIGLVGANVFFKVMAGFLANASGMGDRVKWFGKKSEARNWLLEVVTNK